MLLDHFILKLADFVGATTQIATWPILRGAILLYLEQTHDSGFDLLVFKYQTKRIFRPIYVRNRELLNSVQTTAEQEALHSKHK